MRPLLVLAACLALSGCRYNFVPLLPPEVNVKLPVRVVEEQGVLEVECDPEGVVVAEGRKEAVLLRLAVPQKLPLEDTEAVAPPADCVAEPLGEAPSVALPPAVKVTRAVPVGEAVPVRAAEDDTFPDAVPVADCEDSGDEVLDTESVATPEAVFDAVEDPVGEPVPLPDLVAELDAVVVVTAVLVGDAEEDPDTEKLPLGEGLSDCDAVPESVATDAEGVRETSAVTDDVPQLLCVGDGVREGGDVGDDGALGVRTADGVAVVEGDEGAVPEVVADPTLVTDAVAHTLTLDVASHDADAAGDAVAAADLVPAAVALWAADALDAAVAELALLPEALPVPAPPLAEAEIDGAADVDVVL
jgi:hypothetical protein